MKSASSDAKTIVGPYVSSAYQSTRRTSPRLCFDLKNHHIVIATLPRPRSLLARVRLPVEASLDLGKHLQTFTELFSTLYCYLRALCSRCAVHVACSSDDRPTSRPLVWIPRSRFPLLHNATSTSTWTGCLLHNTASLPTGYSEAAMSTPSTVAVGNGGAMQQASASPAANDNDNTGDIPRRPMRGKHV